jgi:squalene cyclase
MQMQFIRFRSLWLVTIGAGFIMLATSASLAQTQETTVDPATEEAINGSLKWLESRQQPEGNWSEHQHKVAMTGYSLMAFLAAGNLPDEGPHGAAVARGAKYLLDSVRADGYVIAADEINNDKGMYGHGIACIAMGEIYGQTHDPKMRPKLERAIKLIVDTQNPRGGWRYFPRIADDDISVTVLQIVALRAAKNDGIDVPKDTIDRAVEYVKSCRSRDGSGGFAYQPGGGPGFARTAAAIYSLQVCGLYDDPMVKEGSEYLIKKQGKEATWFEYGNFYAAPAQYMIGGETWKNWYQSLRKTLMGRVKRRGDERYWTQLPGDGGGDELYATAVNTLILAMPYHYIPLYQR